MNIYWLITIKSWRILLFPHLISRNKFILILKWI